MIVNSSRGGGSKDTWVLEDSGEPGGDDRAEHPSPQPIPPVLPDVRYGHNGWSSQQQQQQQ